MRPALAVLASAAAGGLGARAANVAVVLEAFIPQLFAKLQTPWRLVGTTSPSPDDLREAVALVPDFQMLHDSSVLSRTLMELPNARLLQLPMTGYDNLNLSAIPARYTLCNVHSAGTAIPEYVLAAILSWNVQLPQLDAAFRTCTWHSGGNTCPYPPMHRESKGQTVGVIGFGTIGQGVAERAAALGMRVISVTTPTPAAPPPPLDWVGNDTLLPRLMQESDFVVVSCPLLPSTTGLVNARLISFMKPAGVLINIARAPIVDEAALYEALANRSIGGAVLDVWWQEFDPQAWPSRFNFSSLPNVWMTPHASYSTAEQHEESLRQVALNLDALARGEPLQNVVRRPGNLVDGPAHGLEAAEVVGTVRRQGLQLL